VERENAFFKSSPVSEYHLPQMNSEKFFFVFFPLYGDFVVAAFLHVPSDQSSHIWVRWKGLDLWNNLKIVLTG
jgi:hypothetical protein